MTDPETDFHGAKLAILVGECVLVMLRDEIDGIPWPGYWDLPGGARDGDETPIQCVLRETKEELGVGVPPDQLHWGGAWLSAPSHIWFFVVEWPTFDQRSIRFGDEGQRWSLAPLGWYLGPARAIPNQRKRLRSYLRYRSQLKASVPET